MGMNTLTRYKRLIATLNRLNEEFWMHQLQDCPHDRKLSYRQGERKKSLELLRRELNDMAFHGVSSPESV